MDSKKLLLVLIAGFCLVSAIPQASSAQWSLGASYEIRNEAPKNGFGVRLERDILQKLPIVNLGLRAHFSYFNEDNNVTENGVSYSRDLTNYDYGLAAVGGVNVGLISPYIGLGLGSSTLDVNRSNLPSGSPLDDNANDSAIYWNGFVGAEVQLIPILHPFVEYRLENVADYKSELSNIDESDGRLMFGVSLSF